MNAAREKVRVARALGDLPKISEAFHGLRRDRARTGRYRGNVVPRLREQLEDRCIDAHSVVSRWDGETMDRDLAVGMLVELDFPQCAGRAPG